MALGRRPGLMDDECVKSNDRLSRDGIYLICLVVEAGEGAEGGLKERAGSRELSSNKSKQSSLKYATKLSSNNPTYFRDPHQNSHTNNLRMLMLPD
jgi:hypothetical protein